jgi:hypothetical protein
MPASSCDHLFGNADALLGSVFLDSYAPTLSTTLLHCLVIAPGLIDISQVKATYGHWREHMVTGGQKCSANLIRAFIIIRALPTS